MHRVVSGRYNQQVSLPRPSRFRLRNSSTLVRCFKNELNSRSSSTYLGHHGKQCTCNLALAITGAPANKRWRVLAELAGQRTMPLLGAHRFALGRAVVVIVEPATIVNPLLCCEVAIAPFNSVLSGLVGDGRGRWCTRYLFPWSPV